MEPGTLEAPPAPEISPAPPPPPPAETLAEPSRKRGSAAVKRKASSNSSPSNPPSKRLIKERNALNIPSLHNGPSTRSRQSPSKFAAGQRGPETAAAAPATLEVAVVPAAGGPIEVDDEEEMVPADEHIVDAEFDLVRSRRSDVHVVPTSAGWFSWKEIHPIEKHTLVSFFNGKSESRTPEIYMEIRNSIMRRFHANPQTQLELKDLEEISVSDSDTKQEVMEFLDHWGLINFHPFPPENQEVNNADTEEENRASLLEKLYQFETAQSCPRLVPKKAEVSPTAVLPRILPESSVADELVGAVGPSVEYHCNSCSADCSRKRYHCQKQADFDLCTECYNNGKFGSGMAPSDFILMESAEIPGVSGGSWTDQETLLLLEALELFGENWNEIAEHVATKTKAQCILHFLQMPIEDPFLEGSKDADDDIQEQTDADSAEKETTESDVPETKEIANGEGKDHPVPSPTDDSKRKDASEIEISSENGANIAIDALKEAFQAIGCMPEQEELPSFAEAGNPVMALAAFLIRLVEPDSASTTFRSSLKAMSEDSPGIQLATRHCFVLEDPPNDTNDPAALESGANDASNGDTMTEEEAPVQVSSGNYETGDCTDKNKENTIPVNNEQSPSAEKDKTFSTENETKSMEVDEKSPKRNEMEGAENEKTLSEENEKMDAEKDKCLSIEPEKTIVKNNEKQSVENEENLSAENEKIPSVINGESEKEPTVCLQDCLDKSSAEKGSSNPILPSEMATSGTKDFNNPILQGEQAGPPSMKDGSESSSTMVLTSTNSEDPVNPMLPRDKTTPSIVKDESDSSSPMVLSSTNPKDSGEISLLGEAVTGVANKVDELNSTTEDKDEQDSVKDTAIVASADKVEQISDTTVIVDPKPLLLEQESKQRTNPDSTVEIIERPDRDDPKVSPTNNGKDSSLMGKHDDQINSSINKLKRAAVTVLSAAAVKAKLLANQEEDQIRQLVSLIIEKQLHKLEAKLALFTDIESVIMRMREQTERARLRLMHERAQIIAARLGVAAPPRGIPPSLPANKLALGLGSSGLNPASFASSKAPPTRRP